MQVFDCPRVPRILEDCRNWHEAAVLAGSRTSGGTDGSQGREIAAGLAVHPHMLRHACGFKLANDGVDTRALQHYLGHKSIQRTAG